jgi:hypothetical protein
MEASALDTAVLLGMLAVMWSLKTRRPRAKGNSPIHTSNP